MVMLKWLEALPQHKANCLTFPDLQKKEQIFIGRTFLWLTLRNNAFVQLDFLQAMKKTVYFNVRNKKRQPTLFYSCRLY